MKLEKIITLANKNTELRFHGMERSLRATGCNLPVWVIPYDDNLFTLPENSLWFKDEKVLNWLDGHGAHRMMRKYQCLLTDNYQFVDSDVVFLLNPEDVLQPHNGFITSCGHWHDPLETLTKESLQIFKAKTTTWQKSVFNAGQFACDSVLYSFEELKKFCEYEKNSATALTFTFHDQPGLNLLVNSTDVAVYNLTQQGNMQSTWAGDYWDNFEKYWQGEGSKPYIIHWAGCNFSLGRPIDNLFLQYLSNSEKERLENALKLKKGISFYSKAKSRAKKILHGFIK